MIVTGYVEDVPGPYGILEPSPCMKCDYIDKNGVVRKISFDSDRMILIRQIAMADKLRRSTTDKPTIV